MGNGKDGVGVDVQAAIASETDFDVTFSPGESGHFVVTVAVSGERRAFALKFGTHSMGSALGQTIDLDGPETWTITTWGKAGTGTKVTVNVKETTPGTRSGTGSGTVV